MNIFEELFDISKVDSKYESYEEQLEDCQRMVDLYLYIVYMFQKESLNGEKDVPFQLKGTVMLPTQMENALKTYHKSQPKIILSEEYRGYLTNGWEYIESRIPEEIEEISNILYILFFSIYTKEYERICFLLALVVNVDRKYERMSAFIQDSANEQIPTLSLVYGIGNLVEQLPVTEVLKFSQEPFKWGFVFDTEYEGLATKLELRESVLWRMLGKEGGGSKFTQIATVVECVEEMNKEAITREEVIEENLSLYRSSLMEGTSILSLLTGPQGIGKKYVVKETAARVGRNILLIEMDQLGSTIEQDVSRILQNLAVASMINGYIPVVCYNQMEVERKFHKTVLETFARFGNLFVFIISNEILHSNETGEFLLFHYPIRRLSRESSEILWKYYANMYHIQFDDSVDLLEISAKYKLTPGQIQEKLQAIHAKKAEEAVTEIDIGNAIRETQVGIHLKHCKQIQPFFQMEDLILPTEMKQTIEHIIKRIKKESFVNRQWGFEKKYAYGRGIGILLYGRSGTGKSMCAHVLASALELDLLKVDLSSVMSKYIGETEKNLTEVFEEAEKTNTILFFDEADSLFSQRSKEMGGANDKYANLETAHLLQKLEEFDGICVLTTNMAMNFDKAFFRRFEYMLNIPYPDIATRIRLWENAFPKECPRDEFLPIELLAEQFEFSPSEIKTIVRNAAFLAACKEDNTVSVEHVVEAIKMDYNKNGKVMPNLIF
ncbi:MAG: AAA family ATPase [Eubacteriales bacterium]